MNCPKCCTKLTLGCNVNDDMLYYPNNLASLYIECRVCDDFLAEYIVRSNGNMEHIDGSEPLKALQDPKTKETFFEEIIGLASKKVSEGNLPFNGSFFYLDHYFRVLLEDNHAIKNWDSEYWTAVLSALYSIVNSPSPIKYTMFLSQIIKDTKEVAPLMHFTKMMLCMEGRI